MHRTLAALLEANAAHAREFQSRFDDVQETQRPEAVTVSCADSRVLGDHLWGNETPGRLFTCANIGNRVVQLTDDGEAVSGDVLYPIRHADTDLVIVVGHTGCGAVTAAYDDRTGEGSEPPGIAQCLVQLTRSLEPGMESLPAALDRTAAVNRLVEYNVDRQVDHLRASRHVPAAVSVVGAVYDFQDVYSDRRGEVSVINIDGERAVTDLREAYPAIADRVQRLWEY